MHMIETKGNKGIRGITRHKLRGITVSRFLGLRYVETSKSFIGYSTQRLQNINCYL